MASKICVRSVNAMSSSTEHTDNVQNELCDKFEAGVYSFDSNLLLQIFSFYIVVASLFLLIFVHLFLPCFYRKMIENFSTLIETHYSLQLRISLYIRQDKCTFTVLLIKMEQPHISVL